MGKKSKKDYRPENYRVKSGSGAPGGRSGSYNNDSLIDDILTKTGSGGKVSDDLLDDILREEASKKAAETGAAPHTAARKTTPDAEMKPADIPVKAAAEPGISGKEQNPAAKAVRSIKFLDFILNFFIVEILH